MSPREPRDFDSWDLAARLPSIASQQTWGARGCLAFVTSLPLQRGALQVVCDPSPWVEAGRMEEEPPFGAATLSLRSQA